MVPPSPETVPPLTDHPPSTIHHQLTIRSRLVLPVSAPPIENGAVRISGNRIIEVGPAGDVAGNANTVDLGDVILLPGLVNAHCHLDYTDMAGHIPPQK